MPLSTGLVDLVSDHLDPRGAVAIAGESAAVFGEALVRAGAAPLAIEADRFALLTDALDAPAVGRVRDLPKGSVDLVVLRRAWRSPVDIAAAVQVAVRAVRPGGEVVLADLDVNRLLAGPTARHPVRLLYLAEPRAAERLRRSTASPAILAMNAVRAGMSDAGTYTYDDELADYEDAARLWAGIRRRGWRGAVWVPQDRSGPLFEEVAASMAGALPTGPVVDREPWYAVIGKPG